MEQRPSVPPLEPGTRLTGRYEVEGQLGRGGMGSVYRVRDLSTGRVLALKRLRSTHCDNDILSALFEREYHTLAHIRHPRVIAVYDYGIDDGTPFYTMELLDGRDLSELAPLPWQQAASVLRDVALSLALLHSRRMLHRDVSPRNVRCASDGTAKLIDFGAMHPMGVAKQLAGTAPYMAPESLRGQSLDARADLFGLGAVAYWVLTAREAYPARDADELPGLWARPVPSPSMLSPEIPAALDQLVMSMLSLDARARPESAAEIVEKLSAIADLPPLEHVGLARAYLKTPSLVGRDDVLLDFRKRLVRAGRGRGSPVLIEADPGMGRTRVLQAFMLEGKLSGMLVLWADAEDAKQGELGVLAALGNALVEAAPELAERTIRPYREPLERLLPVLRSRPNRSRALDSLPDAWLWLPRLSAAMRDWLLAVSRRRSLLIAVDDLERCDRASLAVLGQLASEARSHKLVVAVGAERDAGKSRSPSLQTLAELGAQTALAPLSQRQNRELLSSVFGEAPHLDVVTDWIHRLAQGAPRTIMDLAQYLVDHDLARYEQGSWSLPRSLRGQALPESLEQAQEETIAQLSPAARQLAEGLCLVTEHAALELHEYVQLADDQDPERTFDALDELLACQVVVSAGGNYHLRHRGLSEQLKGGLSRERAQLLHRRLADVYDRRAEAPDAGSWSLLAAFHHDMGGNLDAAAGRLLALHEPTRDHFGASVEGIELYKRCLQRLEAAGAPPAQTYPLRRLLLVLSTRVDASLTRYAPDTLAQLRRDTGLELWDRYPQISDEKARAVACIRSKLERYRKTPPAQRGVHPIQALEELAVCALLTANTRSVTMDRSMYPELLELVGRFHSLSQAADIVYEVIRLLRDESEGQYVTPRRVIVTERLSQPVEHLSESWRTTVRSLQLFWAGLSEACQGLGRALGRAQELERSGEWAPLGAHLRMVHHLFRGEASEAEVARRARELLLIRAGRARSVQLLRARVWEARGHFACGNLLGVKRLLGPIKELATLYPAWGSELSRVRGYYQALRGEYDSALLELRAASDWAGQASCLLALGRLAELVALTSERLEIGTPQPEIDLELRRLQVLAKSRLGQEEAAQAELDELVVAAEARGVEGIPLGSLYEARARVAISLDDEPSFAAAAARLQQLYSGKSASLSSRYGALLGAARGARMHLPDALVESATALARNHHVSGAETQIDTGQAPVQRVRRALRLLVKDSQASGAYLFGMRPKGLRAMEAVHESKAPEGLSDMLELYLAAEVDPAGGFDPAALGLPADLTAWINDGEHYYFPVLLSSETDEGRVVAGVAALQVRAQEEPEVTPDLILKLSRALLDSGQVVPAPAAA